MKTACLILALALCCSCTSTRLLQQCNDTAIRDIEQIDDCLLGKDVQTALARLQIDTGATVPFEEPPLTLRGLHLWQGDSCEITFYIRRTPVMNAAGHKVLPGRALMLRQKITGLHWRKKANGKQCYLGNVPNLPQVLPVPEAGPKDK